MKSQDLETPVYQKKELIFFAVLAFCIPLGYVLYTKHIWEDFFITFRHSQNLCEGHGLVYNPGERVHGFTSPLGVLLPAGCYLVTGQTSYLAALWLFRLICLIAFVGGGFFILKSMALEGKPSRFVSYAFSVLYVLEIKSVAFSMNGMETAFMLFFLGWAFYLLHGKGLTNWFAGGLCWAGFMWTRPDGCFYIAALVITYLGFRPETRKEKLWAVAKSGLVALLLYLPWFLWAWSYYGSPIPNTVLAKSPEPQGPFELGKYLLGLYMNLPHRAAQVFYPIYYGLIWHQPEWIGSFCYVVGVFCAIYWLLPTRDNLGRMASLCFVLVCLYFCNIPGFFPWYPPPAALCGVIVLARGVSALAQAITRSLLLSRLFSGGVLAVVGAEMACVFAMTAWQMRIQEKEVEIGNRTQIGLWLKDRVGQQETVFLEPVGYIGYFSHARVMDFPGLVSPQVVELRMKNHLNFNTLIGAIQPDWAVLRPWEATAMSEKNPFFRDHYEEVKRFDVTGNLIQYGTFPGAPYLLGDAVFCIFKKKAQSDLTALDR